MTQNKHNNIVYIFLLIAFTFFSESSWAQFTIPNKPPQNIYVYDYIDLLNQQQKEHLQNKLYRYEDSTSTQITIAIIDDLKGEDIRMLSTHWAHLWGVGGKAEDNGIFILLKKDKIGAGGEIDITTGYGIEYRMTDRMTKQIINRIVIPNFQQQRYYDGLDQAVDAIISILAGEFEGSGIQIAPKVSWIPLLFIFIILFIILFSNSKKGGRGGGGNGHNNAPSLLDILILGSMGSSSGGGYRGRSGGGFGGGSFGGGFGGGGFGGGGASGRW